MIPMNEILKPGAKLTAHKIRNTKKVRAFLELKAKEQDTVLALKKIDYEKLANTFVTI